MPQAYDKQSDLTIEQQQIAKNELGCNDTLEYNIFTNKKFFE